MENYKPTRTLTEMFAEIRENFEKENGRLLTEDEALAYTEEIKRNIQARKDKQEEDADIKRIRKNLVNQAYREMNEKGRVEVICPKCQEHPTFMTTSGGERTRIFCQCRYILYEEINF